MKSVIFLALLGLAARAEARMPLPRMDVVEAAVDTSTSSAINISSTSYTNVVSGGVALESATILEIYNSNATYSIYCGFDSNVSTDSTKITFGREIQPKTGMYYGINMDKISIYCKSADTATVTTALPRAVITKGR